MRVIVAGCRDLIDPRWYALVREAIERSRFDVTTLISGGATGVDTHAENWARRRGIMVERHPARWKELGRKAGPVRNAEMVAVADALIAVWDGGSRGTRDVIEKAGKAGLTVYVHHFERREP